MSGVMASLARVREDLEQGAIASVTPERIRLRNLPIAPNGAPTSPATAQERTPVGSYSSR